MENGLELLVERRCWRLRRPRHADWRSVQDGLLPLRSCRCTRAFWHTKQELLATLSEFAEKVRYLVPSFDPRDEHFDHIRYWRGPAWAMINFMIAKGLRDIGENEWAERIRSDTRELIRNGRFCRVLFTHRRSRLRRRNLLLDSRDLAGLGTRRIGRGTDTWE